MAFVLNSPRLEICLAGSPVILNLFTEFFIFDISFPLRIPLNCRGGIKYRFNALTTSGDAREPLRLPAFNRSRIHVENFGKFLFINLHETVSQQIQDPT